LKKYKVIDGVGTHLGSVWINGT